MASLDDFSDALVQSLVATLIRISPSLRIPLLASLGSRFRDATITTIFQSLSVPDDARIFQSNTASLLPISSPITALLINPARYAPHVKRIEFTDPVFYASIEEQAPVSLFQFDESEDPSPVNVARNEADDEGDDDRPKYRNESGISPIPSRVMTEILSACSNLEEFRWVSSTPLPDGICETLSSHNQKLNTFSFAPESPILPPQLPLARSSLPKWDAPSLALLSSLPLTTLHLSRITQLGSRVLSSLFRKLGEYSNLEDVKIDFVWLDDGLCERLVEAGRRIRRLQIGTGGTKLSDRGIVAILEGCDALEEFGLREAQGRLSRSLWTKVKALPPSLRVFRVLFSETGPHHSWTADHLQSLPSLDISSLKHLSMSRIIRPLDPQVDDLASLKPLPKYIVDALKEAKALKVLECDWWAWRSEDLKDVLEACPGLETIKITFDAPFSKLLSMTSVFANLSQLEKLQVSIPQTHAPSPPPSPSISTSASMLTPTASPISTTGKPFLTPIITGSSFSGSLTLSSIPEPLQTPPSSYTDAQHHAQLSISVPTTSNIPALDPALPLIRDVRKFVRRCPKLSVLEWYGKNARGSWIITRDLSKASSSSVSSSNVKVDYVPAPLYGLANEEMVEKLMRESDALQWGWTPTVGRVGQIWTGASAEAAFAEFKEDPVPEKESKKKYPALPAGPISASSGGVASRRIVSTDSSQGSKLPPVLPITPLSPVTRTHSHRQEASSSSSDYKDGSGEASPRRMPSEGSLKAEAGRRTCGNGSGGRMRSATTSGGSAIASSQKRNGFGSGGVNKDGRGGGGRGGGSTRGGGVRRASVDSGANGFTNGRGVNGSGAGRGRGSKKPRGGSP